MTSCDLRETKWLITARKQSCGKVLFSQVSCLSTVGRGLSPPQPMGMSRGWYSSPLRYMGHEILRDMVDMRAVRIPLECFLVSSNILCEIFPVQFEPEGQCEILANRTVDLLQTL